MLFSCVVLILAFNVVPIAAAECNPPIIVQKDVVIIGTGMAGLSAGKRIREVDPSLDFVILERQGPERIGGRVRSNDEWFPGFIVEEGANWLVDIPGNIELTLAERYSLDTFEQDFLNFNVYQYDASDDSSRVSLIHSNRKSDYPLPFFL
jgi:monoamine oxidase